MPGDGRDVVGAFASPARDVEAMVKLAMRSGGAIHGVASSNDFEAFDAALENAAHFGGSGT